MRVVSIALAYSLVKGGAIAAWSCLELGRPVGGHERLDKQLAPP